VVVGACDDGLQTDGGQIDTWVVAESVGETGEPVRFAEVRGLHLFSFKVESDACDMGTTNIEQVPNPTGFQLLEKLGERAGTLAAVRGFDGLIHQHPDPLFECRSMGSLREGAFFSARSSCIQAFPLVDPPRSGGAGNWLKTLLLFYGPKHRFDLPEVTQVLAGQGSVSTNTAGYDVHMFVFSVMMLDHGITVPAHLLAELLGHEQPVITCQVFPRQKRNREVTNWLLDAIAKLGDSLQFFSQIINILAGQGASKESCSFQSLLGFPEQVTQERAKFRALTEFSNHGGASAEHEEEDRV